MKFDEFAQSMGAGEPEATPVEATPTEAPEEAAPGASPQAAYVIEPSDVGKKLSVLIEAVEANTAAVLTEKELDALDEHLLKGYTALAFKMGRKVEVEFQTQKTDAQVWSDALMLEEAGTTTQVGRVRLGNIHALAVHLYRYGNTWPSYPLTAAGQAQAAADDDAMRRRAFEAKDGLVQRVAFCRELDSLIFDRLLDRLRTFHLRAQYLLRYEALENF